MKALVLGATALALSATSGVAQDSSFADPAHFTGTSGEQVYTGLCQGCHMPDGEGAVGAGAYPPLAGNEKLESADYPIYLVIHGQKAMPPLGEILNDQQIAAVVEYIRTHFGNNYPEPVPVESVAAAR